MRRATSHADIASIRPINVPIRPTSFGEKTHMANPVNSNTKDKIDCRLAFVIFFILGRPAFSDT